MSKLFSILLSLFILLQSLGLHPNDITQFDEFIEHAQFHSEQYGDNVFVFISKHYGELRADHEKQHQEEKESHEELPFHHQSQQTAITDFTLNMFVNELRLIEFSELNTSNFYYQPPFSSLHPEGILQPPRHS